MNALVKKFNAHNCKGDDMSLPAQRRKGAKHEMPGLIAIRKKHATAKPIECVRAWFAASMLLICPSVLFADVGGVPPSQRELAERKAADQLQPVQELFGVANTVNTGLKAGLENLGNGPSGTPNESRKELLKVPQSISVVIGTASVGLTAAQVALATEQCARDPKLEVCSDIAKLSANAVSQVAGVANDLGKGSKVVGPVAGAVSASVGVLQNSYRAVENGNKGDTPKMWADIAEACLNLVDVAASVAVACKDPRGKAIGAAWATGRSIGDSMEWISKKATGRTLLENYTEETKRQLLSGYMPGPYGGTMLNEDTVRRLREQEPNTPEWGARLDREAHDLWFERYQAPRDAAARRQAFENMRTSNEVSAQREAARRAQAEAAAQQSLRQDYAAPDEGAGFMLDLLGAVSGQLANEYSALPGGTGSGITPPTHHESYCELAGGCGGRAAGTPQPGRSPPKPTPTMPSVPIRNETGNNSTGGE